MKIVNGVARITLFKDNPSRLEAVGKQLRHIDGLDKISIVVKPSDTDKPRAISIFRGLTGEAEAFPTGDLF